MDEHAIGGITERFAPAAPAPAVHGALDVLMAVDQPGVGVLLHPVADRIEEKLSLDQNRSISPSLEPRIREVVSARKFADGGGLSFIRILPGKDRCPQEF